AYQAGFGPLLPGFQSVPFGDADALARAINERTAAVIFEPIQGEGGIIVPPDGYLRAVRELCDRHHVLMVADEIQTGLGRTGQMFACQWEQVQPDLFILGKALGGGILPISAVAGKRAVMEVFTPGSHGSTFGGNPLACAVAQASLDVLIEEDLPGRARRLGPWLMQQLQALNHPVIREVRGRGLLIGMELTEPAAPWCHRLLQAGLLCKETHERVLRFAPPLVITQDELTEAVHRIQTVFGQER
ncbi:MAG: aminotransferase class III-fold pyridoxal phosphate-dependent enzyme, partial [Alicyclobacillus sp.]|nr:aminotransferase class III-fold pyridoxal phosphate-dependent enzyme [Alicyclobacillus sp.]